MNDNIQKAPMVPPFVRFVCSAVPMVFDDSLSYYEALCALWKWLQDDVVDVINNNATVTEEYIELTKELKTFVEDYFDNLDVQEEINNKLDQMAEDGQLEEIIGHYLDSIAVFGFNTVSDLSEATNLVNGSFAQTFGFHALDDGGGARYYIRTIVNTDVIDGVTKVALTNDNTLVAILVKDDKMSVKQFGAYGDDTHDDTSAITTSLNYVDYAFLPHGTYLTSSTISVGAKQKLFGEDYLNTTIHYSGNSNAITEVDSVNTVNFTIHDLTVSGTEKTGTGLYMWRTSKTMPTPGDSFANVYNVRVSNFDTGLFIGQNQNVSKYTNITAEYNNAGILLDHANDIHLNTIVSRSNTKDGIKILSSSVIMITNAHAFYNGSADNTAYYNFNFSSSSGINISNLVAQESYGDNIYVNYTNNLNITNAYLSWPGLTKTTNLRQVHLLGCRNVRIDGCTQNGQYNVSGYNNYIIALQNNVQNCHIELTAEDNFPVNQKLQNISGTQSANVYNGNTFDIRLNDEKRFAKVNYLKNGTLINKTDLTAVGNSGFCSWVNGKLRVDMTGQTYARDVHWKIAELPRPDIYTTYIHFKSVSGTGIVSFNAPGAVSVQNVGNDYYVSFTKYMSSTAEDQTITLQVGKNIVLDVVEAGICLGCSGMFNLPLSANAMV